MNRFLQAHPKIFRPLFFYILFGFLTTFFQSISGLGFGQNSGKSLIFSEVPSQVSLSFANQFPDAKKIRYRLFFWNEEQHILIKFKLNRISQESLFSLDGRFAGLRKTINQDSISQFTILKINNFLSSVFDSFSILKIIQTKNSASEWFTIEVEGKQNKNRFFVIYEFDEFGNLKKESEVKAGNYNRFY
jgi:hypothetical protein